MVRARLFLFEIRAAIARVWRAPAFALGVLLSYSVGLLVLLGTVAIATQYGMRYPGGVGAPETLRRVLVHRSSGSSHYVVAPVMSYAELTHLQRYGTDVPLEGYTPTVAVLGVGHSRYRVRCTLTTPGLLRLLQVRLTAGRFPDSAEVIHGSPVAVIAHELWRRQFDKSPKAIGSIITLNGQAVRVVGIVAPTFSGLDRALVEVWMPVDIGQLTHSESAQAFRWSAIGRVRPDQSARAFAGRLREIMRAVPSADGVTTITIATLRADRFGAGAVQHRAAILSLLMASGVFVLALANCALLVLARFHERLDELLVRSALGATLGTLSASIALEVLMLLTPATAVVLLIVRSAADVATSLALPSVRADHFLIWAALALLAGGAGVVLAGAALPLREHITHPLARRRAEYPRSAVTARFILVGAYVALVCALTVSCVPVLRRYATVRRIQPGFSGNEAIVTTISDVRLGRSWREARVVDATLNDLRALPFVQAAGVATAFPFRTSLTAPINQFTGEGDPLLAQLFYVRGAFLTALGVAVVAGASAPLERDASGVAVISEALARRWWGASTIGRCVYVQGDRCTPVVGIAADVNVVALGEASVPTTYTSLPWDSPPAVLHFVARSRFRPTASEARAMDRVVAAAFPGSPARTEFVRAIVGEQSSFLRAFSATMSLLLGIAGVLAFLGLRASLQYSIQQRRHELGIRSALGGAPASLFLLILLELARPALAGAAIGISAGILVTRLTDSTASTLAAHAPIQILTGACVPAVLIVLSCIPAISLARRQPRELLHPPRVRRRIA